LTRGHRTAQEEAHLLAITPLRVIWESARDFCAAAVDAPSRTGEPITRAGPSAKIKLAGKNKSREGIQEQAIRRNPLRAAERRTVKHDGTETKTEAWMKSAKIGGRKSVKD
jgi:hypothetical protein